MDYILGFFRVLGNILELGFLLVIVVLGFWRALRPSLDMIKWRNWLRVGIVLGIGREVIEVLLFTGSEIIQYASRDAAELTGFLTGPYALMYWSQPIVFLLMIAVLIIAQKRASWWLAWVVALLLSVPVERLVIIITSMHRDYLPSSWTLFHPGMGYFTVPITLVMSALAMLWAQRRALDTRTTG